MSKFTSNTSDDVAIATIRTLAVDVVGKANSGHPGLSTIFIIQILIKLYEFRCTSGYGPRLSCSFFAVCSNFLVINRYCIKPYFNTRFLNANPKNSKWFNRDRFVLSNGLAARSSPWISFTCLKYHYNFQTRVSGIKNISVRQKFSRRI